MNIVQTFEFILHKYNTLPGNSLCKTRYEDLIRKMAWTVLFKK